MIAGSQSSLSQGGYDGEDTARDSPGERAYRAVRVCWLRPRGSIRSVLRTRSAASALRRDTGRGAGCNRSAGLRTPGTAAGVRSVPLQRSPLARAAVRGGPRRRAYAWPTERSQGTAERYGRRDRNHALLGRLSDDREGSERAACSTASPSSQRSQFSRSSKSQHSAWSISRPSLLTVRRTCCSATDGVVPSLSERTTIDLCQSLTDQRYRSNPARETPGLAAVDSGTQLSWLSSGSGIGKSWVGVPESCGRRSSLLRGASRAVMRMSRAPKPSPGPSTSPAAKGSSRRERLAGRIA